MMKSAKRKAHDAKKAEIATSPRARWLEPPYAPVVVDEVDLAFPANVEHLMPDPETVQDVHLYDDLVSSWFFRGLSKFEPVPREGIDPRTALRHINCVLHSYQPQHQHKTAAVQFLLDKWFSSIEWSAR